ncbi:porin [Myroides injenensis]|uniref:porin n=1 Tax=Myroides injenensis TaxID=1183151 RepID=UPI000289B30D|nr:porin [Myroides injenensis]
MRKLLFFALLSSCCAAYAQKQESQNDSIYKPIIPIEKQGLLKNVDVIFNTRFAFDNDFLDGSHTNSEFKNNQIRLEIKGKIHDKVYFRFRDRYTKDPRPGDTDKISRSTDLAFVGITLSPKTELTFGKLCADWGGNEFDLNPIDVLEYNDILENADNFLTGVGLSHQVAANHRLNVQVLNSRNDQMKDIYKDRLPEGQEESKMPLAFVGNWRGSFFDGAFKTSYSYSYFQETKKKAMNYISLGNTFQKNNFTLMYDFQYSHEGLDRTGIVSGMTQTEDKPFAAINSSYLENWLRMEYLVAPKVNLSLTLMTSNAYGKNITGEDSGTNHLRTSYGFIPSIQYLPFKDINIRFYVSYVGRYYEYSGFAKEQLGQSNYNTGRLSIGFIAPLLVL